MTDVYKRLAKHLDNLPASFPATDSGVELRILKHLFTPEEADAATAVSVTMPWGGLFVTWAGIRV